MTRAMRIPLSGWNGRQVPKQISPSTSESRSPESGASQRISPERRKCHLFRVVSE